MYDSLRQQHSSLFSSFSLADVRGHLTIILSAPTDRGNDAVFHEAAQPATDCPGTWSLDFARVVPIRARPLL